MGSSGRPNSSKAWPREDTTFPAALCYPVKLRQPVAKSSWIDLLLFEWACVLYGFPQIRAGWETGHGRRCARPGAELGRISQISALQYLVFHTAAGWSYLGQLIWLSQHTRTNLLQCCHVHYVSSLFLHRKQRKLSYNANKDQDWTRAMSWQDLCQTRARLEPYLFLVRESTASWSPSGSLTICPEDERSGGAAHSLPGDAIHHDAGVISHVGRLDFSDIQVPSLLRNKAAIVLLDEVSVFIEDPRICKV